MQKKDRQISIPIEPAWHNLVLKIDNGNTASYIRDLIVQDLHKRGMITDQVMKELFGLVESEAIA